MTEDAAHTLHSLEQRNRQTTWVVLLLSMVAATSFVVIGLMLILLSRTNVVLTQVKASESTIQSQTSPAAQARQRQATTNIEGDLTCRIVRADNASMTALINQVLGNFHLPPIQTAPIPPGC